MKPVSSPPSPECDHRSTEKGVYVASRASIPKRSAMWRSLRNEGWNITSSWIDEAGEGETADFGELWDRIMREIATAEKVVLYAEPGDFPLKGAILEAGIALGMGKPVIVCLPGVELEGRTKRPLGSWIEHRNVTRCDNLLKAMAAPPAHQENSPRSARPVAFRVPRIVDDKLSKTEFRLFDDEDEARRAAYDIGADDYDGLYLVADRRSAPEPAPQVREALEQIEALSRTPEMTARLQWGRAYAIAKNALNALTPVVAREPVAWRVRVRQGDATYHLYTEALPFEPWTGSPITVLSEPEPLFTSPPPASAVREALEKAAQIVDAEAARILSKQEPTTDPLSIMDTINMHLRMMACALPEVATAIRALSKGTADESTATGCGRRGGNCQCSSKEECIDQ